ncbi:hypothetical protein [Streptomyces fungicidicus]|uniref:hypothetical protein n=1 Tax=Streptomyces fungicidicus TaxID=68203 RepID=UPI00223BA03F|nr:hypothetical protein [Streptomyces fungicidicus]
MSVSPSSPSAEAGTPTRAESDWSPRGGQFRSLRAAFATSVSVALFGGTAPYLMTWFDQSGVGWGFRIWVGVLSSPAILGGTLVRETKGIDLGAVTSPFRERGPARTEQEGATR